MRAYRAEASGPVLLVANKIDLEGRAVSREMAVSLFKELNLDGYFEVSCATGEQMESILDFLRWFMHGSPTSSRMGVVSSASFALGSGEGRAAFRTGHQQRRSRPCCW